MTEHLKGSDNPEMKVIRALRHTEIRYDRIVNRATEIKRAHYEKVMTSNDFEEYIRLLDTRLDESEENFWLEAHEWMQDVQCDDIESALEEVILHEWVSRLPSDNEGKFRERILERIRPKVISIIKKLIDRYESGSEEKSPTNEIPVQGEGI